jgi:heme A synthase
MSVVLHILNAMLVGIVVLVVCILTVRVFPLHPLLRPAAVALGVVTAVQVALGFPTFILLVMGLDNSLALLIVSVAHVTTGAVTLAASVLLAMRIRQCVRSSGH